MELGLGVKSELESVLSGYAERLASTTKDHRQVETFARLCPRNFYALCKFHLSLVVDLPIEFAHASQSDSDSSTFWRNRPWTRFAPSVAQSRTTESSHVESVSEEKSHIYRNVVKLMDHLCEGDYLKTEGIFRKTGNVLRQRELRRRVLCDAEVDFPFQASTSNGSQRRRKNRLRSTELSDNLKTENAYNAHDYAATLKNVLHDMPEPILTKELLPVFAAVSTLTMGNLDDSGTRVPLLPADYKIAVAKQLKAVRILRFLLPERNQELLRRLLDLLRHTLKLNSFNRMSPDSLGTLFGPLLLAPIGTSATELQCKYVNLSRLTSLMIEQGSEGVFGVPTSLADDVYHNMYHGRGSLTSSARSISTDSGVDSCGSSDRDLKHPLCISGMPEKDEETRSIASSTSPTVLYTGVIFAQRSSNETPTRVSDTEFAVAELCATVQAMPDTDPRKVRLIQRINNSNGGLTPNLQAEYRRLREASLASPSRTPFNRGSREVAPNSFSGLCGSVRLKIPEKRGNLAKRQCTNDLPGLVIAPHKGGEATTSSSSLDARCTSLCCPLIGVLASPFRTKLSGAHVPNKQPQYVDDNKENISPSRGSNDRCDFSYVPSEDENGRSSNSSPIFFGMGLSSPLSLDYQYVDQTDFMHTSRVMSTAAGCTPLRRSSCLSQLRVRRNYVAIDRRDDSTADAACLKTFKSGRRDFISRNSM